ncbi:DUF536 domain-containing protein [Companilactobacillus paralimentarius]|uniref:DUF536 domain-containing protein n=1 Tax=Companilactobacillus paralimentarius TaxID=83526 RepID=UPI00384CFA76
MQSNNILIEQLREKDKQIEHLQKLLDQSQQLQLMAEAQTAKSINRQQERPKTIKAVQKSHDHFGSDFSVLKNNDSHC